MSSFSTPRKSRHKASYGTTSKLRLRLDHDPDYGFKRLRLGGRELEDIPSELFELTDLEYLTLSPDRKSCLFFRLNSVPREIGRLVNLRVLCLDTNELTEIHSSVCDLEHLERLVLSNNLLTTLPREFKELKRLKSLHLANNYYETIPDSIFFLRQLEFLDVSDNKIITISDHIGNLSNLETLLLLYNLLESLPEPIGKCTHLRNLWLGMNRLTTLPRSLGRLQKLDWAEHNHSSNFEGNPLVYPPIEICRRGPASIEQYFKNYSTRTVTEPNRSSIGEEDDIPSDDSGSSLEDATDDISNGRLAGAKLGGIVAMVTKSVTPTVVSTSDAKGIQPHDESPWKPRRPDNRPGRQRPNYPPAVDMEV